jgi:hypothetical protein
MWSLKLKNLGSSRCQHKAKRMAPDCPKACILVLKLPSSHIGEFVMFLFRTSSSNCFSHVRPYSGVTVLM